MVITGALVVMQRTIWKKPGQPVMGTGVAVTMPRETVPLPIINPASYGIIVKEQVFPIGHTENLLTTINQIFLYWKATSVLTLQAGISMYGIQQGSHSGKGILIQWQQYIKCHN